MGKELDKENHCFLLYIYFLEEKKYMASTLVLTPPNPDYIKDEKCNSRIYLLFIVLPHGLLKTRLKITQFREMLRCHVPIVPQNTSYFLVNFFLDGRKSRQVIQPPQSSVRCLHGKEAKKIL